MRHLWSRFGFLFLITLVTGGAAGCGTWTRYRVEPAPRAGDGTPPVKAQVRNIFWARQTENSGVGEDARIAVDLDVYDADATRAFAVGQPQLKVTPALGGTTWIFAAQQTGPAPPLGPGQGQTRRFRFTAPDHDPPPGPQRIVLVVPVADQPTLEITLADSVPGGPRWAAGTAAGTYFFGGVTQIGTPVITVVEPIGFSRRASWDRLVVGLGTTLTLLQVEALAGGPPAFGLSFIGQVAWEPWRWHIAPYVEGGIFTGQESPPRGYFKSSRRLNLPRIGAGLLFSWGPRLGGTGALPFERPLSPQRRSGLRIGYAQWFNTAERGGSPGVQITFERGFGP